MRKYDGSKKRKKEKRGFKKRWKIRSALRRARQRKNEELEEEEEERGQKNRRQGRPSVRLSLFSLFLVFPPPPPCFSLPRSFPYLAWPCCWSSFLFLSSVPFRHDLWQKCVSAALSPQINLWPFSPPLPALRRRRGFNRPGRTGGRASVLGIMEERKNASRLFLPLPKKYLAFVLLPLFASLSYWLKWEAVANAASGDLPKGRRGSREGLRGGWWTPFSAFSSPLSRLSFLSFSFLPPSSRS